MLERSKVMRPSTQLIRRTELIRRMKHRLQARSFPRLQMALIVALTGGFGLLASFTLLGMGVTSMAVRYPTALTLAYAFFLFLIWLWIRTQAEDYADLPDLIDLAPRPDGAGCGPPLSSGEGGDFGGGGASGSWDASSSTHPLSDSLGAAGDADELAIPLIAIVLALGIALALMYVVYVAPVLFAELLVDGALSYALLRRMHSEDRRHWLSSTFRRTLLPFVITAGFLAGVGAAMAVYAPGAHSIGQVLEHAGQAESHQTP